MQVPPHAPAEHAVQQGPVQASAALYAHWGGRLEQQGFSVAPAHGWHTLPGPLKCPRHPAAPFSIHELAAGLHLLQALVLLLLLLQPLLGRIYCTARKVARHETVKASEDLAPSPGSAHGPSAQTRPRALTAATALPAWVAWRGPSAVPALVLPDRICTMPCRAHMLGRQIAC